jgi:hypothetical protein
MLNAAEALHAPLTQDGKINEKSLKQKHDRKW